MCATLANGGTLTEPGFQRSEIAIPEDTDPEDFIGGILREKCHPSDDVYGFLPYCELTATLTPETIKIILERKLGLKGEKLDTMLVLSGRLIRIFAILIFAGMTEYIEKFIDTGITDDDLPLPHGPGRSLDSRISFLTRAQVDSFCFFQWLVNVPVLNLTADESQPVVYAKETRMPFLSVEPRPRGRGGQGRVSKIIMHPDHVRGQASTVFALKRIDSHARWQDEIAALNAFRAPNSRHKNVIRLLLAYEHIERGLYLVFPLAKGDLDDFWKAKDTQFPSSEDAYWLIQQCADIASALYEFHYHPSLPKKHGRHGDIKPENILWFQDQTESHGRLVVADLTMVRFHSTATLDDTTAQGRAISITYKPPEVDVEIKPKKSQAYDVWSLGCVFFQFMVWHLLGYDAARDGQQFLNAQNHWCQSFKRARINNDNAHGWTALEDKFFNVRFDMSSGRLVAEVKESVEQWARLLHSSQYCSRAIHDLLELVMTRMFVIDPNKRIAMSEVKSAMSEIFEKCSISSDYYRKGVPRTDLNVDAGSLKFARTSPEDYSTSPSISSSCICSDTCNASSSFEQLTELFGVTSEVDEDARQPQIISDSTTPVPRLPALIHALDDIDDKLRQNYQQTETSPLQDSVSPASLAEIQAAAVKSSLKASSSPSRLPIPVPTTVGTSYLQTSSDVSSIRRRPHSSTSNTDPSFVDQEDPLWLPTGEFLGAHNRSQNRLDYDSLFNMSETDIRNTDTTSNAAVERNEDRMSTVRPVSSANAEDLNASNSGRTRESRGWKQKIGIRIHKLSEYVRWHHISEKVRGWKY